MSPPHHKDHEEVLHMLINIDVGAIEGVHYQPKEGEGVTPAYQSHLTPLHGMCVAEHPPHLTACTMMTCLVVMIEGSSPNLANHQVPMHYN